MRKFVGLRGLVRACGLGTVLAAALVGQGTAVAGDNQNGNADNTKWQGLGWGLGVATDFDLGGARVVSADNVNNILRVSNTSSNVGISFVLEAHYFLRDYPIGYSGTKCVYVPMLPDACSNVAIGPFVAIEVGDGSSAAPSDGPITAYAMG